MPTPTQRAWKQSNLNSDEQEPQLSVARVLRDADVKSIFEDKNSKTNSQDNSPLAPVEEALSLFDQLSTQLTSSYRGLEQKVAQLKSDLSEEVGQRQEQLKEKESIATRLSTLLEVLPAGVVLLDAQGRVSECNPAAKDLLGEPLEGQPWVDIITRCFAPRRDDGHEVSLKDGRRVRIETRSMNNEEGQLILLSDLTETRRLQAKVSRAERLSSLGKMVASLAHQIRTPLSTAMLYAGHLSQPTMDEPMRLDCADKLLARLTHLEHQIRDMLIFAKGDTRLAEQLSIVEFSDALKRAIEPVFEQHNVEVIWNLKPTNHLLMCNRETLVGACLNLVNNSIEALDATKGSGQKACIGVSLDVIARNKLRVMIADNGPGLPTDQYEQVMEPFFTTKSQGTGLGLSVVNAVATAHKGKLQLFSEPKQGLTAQLTLPVFKNKTNAMPETVTPKTKARAKRNSYA